MADLAPQLTHTRRSVTELYADFVQQQPTAPPATGKLNFTGVDELDVYNITAPFSSAGKRVIAGRVEARDSQQAQIYFFEQDASGLNWQPISDAPKFDLQDPFVTRIHGELVLGGVAIHPHPEQPDRLIWHTVFYRGDSIMTLKPFARGPQGMKDIRLCELADKRIAIFTRPQGEVGGRGTIGYTEIDTLEQLTCDVITQAELLDNQFYSDEWGGANEVHRLSDNRLGVLGHVARFDEQGNRHYYPATFIFAPSDRSYSDLRIIAERSQFQPGASKRPDLVDVVFSGGLPRQENGSFRLYAGVGDAEAHWIDIEQPFV